MWYTVAMNEPQKPGVPVGTDQLGKTRTWWHPLLARLLDDVLASAYTVRDEVLVASCRCVSISLPIFFKEIGELRRTGHALLHYVLQQVGQFRSFGEGFAMQHADTEYLGELEEELQTAVLATIPVDKASARAPNSGRSGARSRGLSPEEVGSRPERRASGAVRELLDRRQGK